MSTTVPSTWDELRTRLATAQWHVGVVGGVAVLASALAMQPLLDGAWWVPRSFVVVLGIVASGLLVRGLVLPAPLQPLLQAAVLLELLCLLFAREQLRWNVLPGPAALTQLRDLAAQGRDFAQQSVPPAGPDLGLLLLIVAGVGLVALSVDTLAAGLDLPGLALLPLGALFVVPWAINRGAAPTWAFIAVACGWLALLAAAQRDRSVAFSPRARPGSSAMGVGIAVMATTAAVLVGGVATARLPYSGLSFGAGLGLDDGTLKLDEMVSLRRSLVGEDDRVVLRMTTTAPRPDYLRLAVLDQFDGEQWTASPQSNLVGSPSRATLRRLTGGSELATYRIMVGPLGGVTVPAPSGAAVNLGRWPINWDLRTSLAFRSDGGDIAGSRVELGVMPPSLDSKGLRAASLDISDTATDPSVLDDDLVDPTPLVGPTLQGMATEITAGAASPFDAALALQKWFTSTGGFTYSTEAAPGSGGSALWAFLQERVGYCEQFAATMALMARSLGIPARVVVGFTQGRNDGKQWVIRGSDAHAWPELWMGSAGWIRFEPTPGAATTTTPSYTLPGDGAMNPYEGPTPGSDAAGQDASGAPAQVPDEDEGLAVGVGLGARGMPIWALLAVLVGLTLLVPALVRIRRRRQRLRRGDGESAYQELADTLVDLGLGTEEATPRATLGAVANELRLLHSARLGGDATAGAAARDAALVAEEALARIRRSVEWQRYGGGPAGGGSGEVTTPPSEVPSPDGVMSRGGVAVAERTVETARATMRPGALAGDVRLLRRQLGRRAGWRRRLTALVAPRSVLAGVSERIGGWNSVDEAA